MGIGRRVRLFFILSIWIIISTALYLSHQILSQSRPKGRLDDEGGVRWRKNSSEERTNIFFLKTHKCGSSTVQNILMRFGYAQHLDFVLPENGNYLGYGTHRFESKCVAKQIMAPNRTFNIFAHHTRFHAENIKAIVKPDAAFVTILREPSHVFESLYHYYDFIRPMRMGLKKLVRSPKQWPRLRQTSARIIYGTNQISWDLGFDTLKFANATGNDTSEMVDDFVRQIDGEFDLVMIMEYMEASLVLLCDLMNWPLERVVHLKLNGRRDDRVVDLSSGERLIILRMNPVDDRVYQHFVRKFRRLVRDYGEEKMRTQVEKLLHLNSDLKRNCNFAVDYEAFRKTVNYVPENPNNLVCRYASLTELQFTQRIREDQFERFKVLRDLDDLTEEPDYQR